MPTARIPEHLKVRTPVEKVPCRFCRAPTMMLGTKECDECHTVAMHLRVMSPVTLSRIITDVMPLQPRRELVTMLVGANLAEKGVKK